jgi:cyclophilin family peptidyl-prolyl cis-trans isomerase
MMVWTRGVAITLLTVFVTAACAQRVHNVSLETTFGVIVIELDSAKAPITVNNFLQYASSGFYNGTIFHRVIETFMIQGGGLTASMTAKQTRPPIRNEADNGLHNYRGTIAMARTSDPHSATSQFFINTVDNLRLDFKDTTVAGWGYCVFGKVVQGMNVVDSISRVDTTSRGSYPKFDKIKFF